MVPLLAMPSISDQDRRRRLVGSLGSVYKTMSSLSGFMIAIMLCYESIGIDGFFIWVTVWVLWRVESRLQKAFRDIGTIWSRGLKLNRSIITVLCDLEQVYLGMEKVIILFDRSCGWDFWNWPLHAKFALGLTEQKTSFLSWPMRWPFGHG